MARKGRRTFDRMTFRNDEEFAVYLALTRIQSDLPTDQTIAIVPNARMRVLGHTFEPDLLVVYRGRTGIIEVDGAAHHRRWAADRSRDYLLENAGVDYIAHIPAEDASDPDEVAAFARRFVRRLSG